MAEELRFDVHAWDDPNGAALTTLETVLAGSKKIDKEFKARGSGNFRIRRDAPEFDATVIARNNIVKAYYLPYSAVTPYFAFRLKTGEFTAVSKRGPSGEVFEFGGPGLREYLSDARLYPEHFTGVTAIPTPSDGKWHWTDNKYGAIFKRLLDEAAARPDGTPIPFITYTWTNTVDTLGAAWPEFDGEFALDIGVNIETAVETMEDLGDLFFRVTPNLVFQAYKDSWGVDRSASAFASGKVRFVKGVNIFNDVEKLVWGEQRASHVIVGGSNYKFVTVADPNYDPGEERVEKFIAYGETDDLVALAKVGQQAIAEGKKAQDAILLEVRVGNTPLSGYYKPGSHYDVGDIITLHSGTGSHNYNNSPHELRSVALIEGDTGKVRVVLELNGDAVGTDDEPGGMFTPDDDCCGGPGSQHSPGGLATDQQASLVAISPSISGPQYDGIGIKDGTRYATWDTGDGEIYHQNAQPKFGARHHIQITGSPCGAGDDAATGDHQLIAGAIFHLGNTGGYGGPCIFRLGISGVHGVGWPDDHPAIGPYRVVMYVYDGATVNVDAPVSAVDNGIPIGHVPALGVSTNAAPIDEQFDFAADLGDVPLDGTKNVIFIVIPEYTAGGYTCGNEVTPSGGYASFDNAVTGLIDMRNPQGPGWYDGPVAGERDGSNNVFTVVGGYDEVRSVTLNGDSVPRSMWSAEDGATIEFIGWAPLKTDVLFVDRLIPS